MDLSNIWPIILLIFALLSTLAVDFLTLLIARDKEERDLYQGELKRTAILLLIALIIASGYFIFV